MQLTYRGHRYSLTSFTSKSSEHIFGMSDRGMRYSPTLSVPEFSKNTSSHWLIYRGVAYCRSF